MGVVKLCGMVKPTDLRGAGAAGADRVGLLIDYPRSPRSLSIEQAAGLGQLSALPVSAVLVNPSPSFLVLVSDRVRPQTVQLSGDESVELVAELRDRTPGVEMWKVIHIPAAPSSSEIEEVCGAIASYQRTGVDKILIDAGSDHMPGGTGQEVSWSAVAQVKDTTKVPVILAGGLTPLNVERAILTAWPDGVDVSSGIEIRRGIKDSTLMREFVAQARKGFDGLSQDLQTRSARISARGEP